jgi:hypothetical protein
MVLTVSFALSPVIGLCCHRHPSDMADPRPVGPTLPPLDLTPASRRQDHTTSPYAAASFVSTPLIAHRPEPALPSRCAPNAAASTASRPYVRDDGQRPSSERDGGSYELDLDVRRSRIFLQKGLDTRIDKLPVGQINGCNCFNMPHSRKAKAAFVAGQRWNALCHSAAGAVRFVLNNRNDDSTSSP